VSKDIINTKKRLGIFTAGFRWSGSSALSDWLESFSSVRKPPGCKSAYDEIRALNYGLTLLIGGVEKTLLYGEQLSRYSMYPDKSQWKRIFGKPLSPKTIFIDALFMTLAKGRLNPGLESYGSLLSTPLGRDYRSDTEYIKALSRLTESARRVIKKHPRRRSWESIAGDKEFSESVSAFLALFYDRLSSSGAVPVFDNAVSALNTRFFDLVENTVFPVQLIMLVKRDPRDQFAELVKYSAKTFSFMVNRFIKDYRKNITGAVDFVSAAGRTTSSSGKIVKLIDFEDFVYDTSGIRTELGSIISALLSDFSFPDDFDHSFYDPGKSKPNIGLWKDSGMKREMGLIKKSLPEFLRPESD
jgi:hypothetical protein